MRLRGGATPEKRDATAVDVTPDLARVLLRRLGEMGVEFVVAPYEADAQLAHLALTGRADIVATIDSDLLAYGCPRVLFNLDPTGHGSEVQLKDLPLCRSLAPYRMSQETLPDLCVLAGCDYLPSIPRMGIRTAAKLLFSSGGDVKRTLKAARRAGYAVPENYEDRFAQARLVFSSQTIFDVTSDCRTRSLRPLPDGMEVPPDYLGRFLPDEVAKGVACGNIHPLTLEPFEGAPVLSHDRREGPCNHLTAGCTQQQQIPLDDSQSTVSEQLVVHALPPQLAVTASMPSSVCSNVNLQCVVVSPPPELAADRPRCSPGNAASLSVDRPARRGVGSQYKIQRPTILKDKMGAGSRTCTESSAAYDSGAASGFWESTESFGVVAVTPQDSGNALHQDSGNASTESFGVVAVPHQDSGNASLLPSPHGVASPQVLAASPCFSSASAYSRSALHCFLTLPLPPTGLPLPPTRLPLSPTGLLVERHSSSEALSAGVYRPFDKSATAAICMTPRNDLVEEILNAPSPFASQGFRRPRAATPDSVRICSTPTLDGPKRRRLGCRVSC